MEQTEDSLIPKVKSAKIVTPDGKEIPIKLGSETAAPATLQPAPESAPAPAPKPIE